ncbi:MULTISPECIES: protein kinase domain-containing protein [Legionella]|uniref:Protein kinase domain-containing protein n=1 Tax=Legionella resiliens TaxID=2905958 RepID=A0ABS8X678_9GAMM|nr:MULTISPECIES: hypothetical protein [unclassified Legionella]MCE0723607.1 hypothetical protein [Legionella sp. 9fVS26]MCE3532760.1 hypothetical protein [Legionella sp. 8cVS16]QLZ68895.1 hypothetical protein FOLKNPGA_01675 [Legionella sp. PC1000]
MPNPAFEFLRAMGVDPLEQPIHLPFRLRKEFHNASEYFRNNQDVFKLGRTDKVKFRERYAIKHGAQAKPPETEHSFFNFNGKLVCTLPGAEGTIGSGNYGKGRLAMDEYGHVFLIKVEKKSIIRRRTKIKEELGAEDVPQDSMEEEISIGKDVRLIIASSQKGGESTEYNEPGIPEQTYVLMEFRGDSVKKKIIKSDLTPEQRLDMAIQAAWQCHLLHQGYLSRSGIPYVHGDLKPDQLVIDAQNQLSLVDFGCANNRLEEKHGNDSGSFDYLSPSCRNYTRREVDNFALLRTIYMPQMFNDRLGNPKQRKEAFNSDNISLLDDECIEQFRLREWFDTSNGKLPKDSSPEQIAFLLILTRLQCKQLFEDYKNNQEAISALNIVYQSGYISTQEFNAESFLTNEMAISCLAELAPIMHLIDKDAQLKLVEQILSPNLNLNTSEQHPLLAYLQCDSQTRHLIAPVLSMAIKEDIGLNQIFDNIEFIKAISPLIRENPKTIVFRPGENIVERLCQEYKEELGKNLSLFFTAKKSLTPEKFKEIFNTRDVMDALKYEVQEHKEKYSKKGQGFFGRKNNDGINKLNRLDSSDESTYSKFANKIEGISPDGALPFFRSRDPEIQKFYCIAHVLLSTVGYIQENKQIMQKQSDLFQPG